MRLEETVPLPPSKIEVALMEVPFDLISTLVSFGCEQAFQYLGQQPHDDNEFYFQLGRRIAQMTDRAYEKRWCK